MNKTLLGLLGSIAAFGFALNAHALGIVLSSTDTPLVVSAGDADASDIVGPAFLPTHFDVTDLNVRVTLTAGDVSDIAILFFNTIGNWVTLFDGASAGASGTSFFDTTFDDEALAAISSGSTPYTGSFLPADPLSPLEGYNLGSGGNWRLQVVNSGNSDATLENWAVEIGVAPEPSILALAGIGLVGMAVARKRSKAT